MRTLRASLCTLEPLVVAHAHEMFEVLGDPRIYEFENEPPPSVEWLRERYARLETRRSADGSEQWLNWVLRLPSRELIGYVQATVRPDGHGVDRLRARQRALGPRARPRGGRGDDRRAGGALPGLPPVGRAQGGEPALAARARAAGVRARARRFAGAVRALQSRWISGGPWCMRRPTNPDDTKTLANDNLVTLTATKTDKDGDSASAMLNIGQNLNFKDDGPSLSTTGTEPTLTVDETVLATNATQSFAANFTSLFGADGAGMLTYALSVVAGASGLVETTTNAAVLLSMNGSVVEGKTAGGLVVFRVSVNASGAVTLDQWRAVVHEDTTNPDDTKTLANDNLVTLTATKTDKDGDSASATAPSIRH